MAPLLYIVGVIAILVLGLIAWRMPMLSFGGIAAAILCGFLCLGVARALEYLRAIERRSRETAEIMRKLLPNSSEDVR